MNMLDSALQEPFERFGATELTPWADEQMLVESWYHQRHLVSGRSIDSSDAPSTHGTELRSQLTHELVFSPRADR